MQSAGVAGARCSTGAHRLASCSQKPYKYHFHSRGSLRRHVVPRAASAAVDPATPYVPSSSKPEVQFDFACPICQQTEFKISSMPTQRMGLSCARCSRAFDADTSYLDLTLTSGVQQVVYQQKNWGGVEIFRNPLVSFVYERGWRQGFAWAGFPGADAEYDIAMEYLAPSKGGVLLDMSCGSGLFTRKFAASGAFSGVIAADFSETMLQQTQAYLNEDRSAQSRTPVVLVRADVGRLPFATGSLTAVHAGAAIHCWPNPQLAFAEISRVLAPGGVFVASTFLAPGAPLGQLLGNDELVRPLNQLQEAPSAYRWWEEAELKELAAAVGLQGFARQRNNRFIMFVVSKPAA